MSTSSEKPCRETPMALPRAGCIIPIADLRGATASKYSKSERIVRNKLASLYRLIDLYGWSDGIYGHSSVRVPHTDNEFLINPFGLLCSEITASSLVKVDIDANIIDPGSTALGFNHAGYSLHSALYSSRPDIGCIIHVHTKAGAAVSCMKCGLLPITQDALSLGEVSYHRYRGIVVTNEEKLELSHDLGRKSKVMILHNHGLVSLGSTVEEAFANIVLLVNACEYQVSALAVGLNNIIIPDVDASSTVVGVDVTANGMTWGLGEMEWEAEMRILDMQGYRTGQIYRTSSLIDSPSTANQRSDVAIPPVTTSLRLALQHQGTSNSNELTDSQEESNAWKLNERDKRGENQGNEGTMWDFLNSSSLVAESQTDHKPPPSSVSWSFLEEPTDSHTSTSHTHTARQSSQPNEPFSYQANLPSTNELPQASSTLTTSTTLGRMAANVAESTSQAAKLTSFHPKSLPNRSIVPQSHKYEEDETSPVGSSSGVSLSPSDEEPHYGSLAHRSAMSAARTVDQLSASAMGELYNPMSVEFVKQSAQRVAQSTDTVAAQLTSATLPMSNYN